MKKHSEDTIKNCIELFQNNKTIEEILNITKVSKTFLWSTLKRNGITRKFKVNEFFYPEEVIKKCIELYNDGKTMREILNLTKVKKRDTVKNFIKKAGIEFKVIKKPKIKKELNYQEIKEICSKYLEGISCSELSKEYKQKSSIIKKCLKENNIKLKIIKTNTKNKQNLIGKVFGRLTVISESNFDKPGTYWNCLCECGNEKAILQDYLLNGDTKSCGCLKTDLCKIKATLMGAKAQKFHPRIASAHKVHKKNYQEIPFETFYQLSQLNCTYCDCPPANNYNVTNNYRHFKEEGNFNYNSLDRLDSNLSHTLDNVVPCCVDCNCAKNDQKLEEFEQQGLNFIKILLKEEK